MSTVRQFTLRSLSALAVLVALAGAAPAATFNFFGVCADCDGIAMAELNLTADYLPDSLIGPEHLVMFTYFGTDLLTPFVITPDNLNGIDGTIPAGLPAPANFFISGFDTPSRFVFFQSSADGNWAAGEGEDLLDEDNGLDSVWTGQTAVPEPSAYLLVGGGLALLGLRRWKLKS